MPWHTKPRIPDLDEEPEYRWPAWFVGLDDEDLFGELHERFNTTHFFIQDPESFHRDANELVREAHDKDHFYRLMEERKKMRLDELNKAHTGILCHLGSGYSRLSDEQRFLLGRLGWFASYDSLVAFLAAFLCPNRHGIEPYPNKNPQPTPPSLDESSHPKEGRPLPSPQHTSSPVSDMELAARLPSTLDDLPPTQAMPSPDVSPRDSRSAKRKRPMQDMGDEPTDCKRQRSETTPCSSHPTETPDKVRQSEETRPSGRTTRGRGAAKAAESAIQSMTTEQAAGSPGNSGLHGSAGVGARRVREKRTARAPRRQPAKLEQPPLRRSARLGTKPRLEPK